MIPPSKILQNTMLNTHAFTRAINQGFITPREDGTLVWTLENHTLLAYFCGRLWCGDKGAYSRRKDAMLWQMGKKAFPAVALAKVFGINSLKQTRNRRKNMPLPVHAELIDTLFDSDAQEDAE